MKACMLLFFLSLFFDLVAQDDPSNSIAKVQGKEEIGGGIVTGWNQSDNIVFLLQRIMLLDIRIASRSSFVVEGKNFQQRYLPLTVCRI